MTVSVKASESQRYMQMALRLARRGISSVEPNPAVGAIIVKANQIIGRGYHKKFGGPHAEINALEDCQSLGVRPNGATMYVTLEPCSHHGKTPPCTQALIAAGIARIFVAMTDPSEHANGRGIEQLREAGIEVHTGICETEARLLNAPFVKYSATGKCWVTLKWAQTIDGKLAWAQKSDEQRWISNELSRRDVHKLRRRTQAILVGINTVIADDPLLTARPNRGTKAARIVMDSFLRLPLDCQLLETAKDRPLIIFSNRHAIEANPWAAEQIADKGAELLAYPDTHGRSNLHCLLDELSRRGISQLLVEGGPTVLASFIKEQLADEIVVYIAPKILAAQGGAEIAGPIAELAESVGLHYVDVARLGDDVRLSGLTDKALGEIGIGPARTEPPPVSFGDSSGDE
ncbi:MAG: bifunctional diaminohydroxyphosphoribosylaminopyrimidine deaminase/5-amino-6-(5-phosphoribosylamino)uracil reductase RibD [Phycisphaerales bacterium]|nr:MAG: bifunctional diaminohydroxyphosphoribosylaminopyrimidine deaminase/5-amino-6-(5-phosphoribosylamino)uracil reductase RibD [Phycisphaerales bacterium]